MTIDPAVVLGAITALSAALGRAAWMIYTDLRRDRDYWRDAYVKATTHTDGALDVVAKVVRDA